MQDKDLSAVQVLRWVMNNTVESTQMGLLEWAKQGLDYAMVKGHPGVCVRVCVCARARKLKLTAMGAAQEKSSRLCLRMVTSSIMLCMCVCVCVCKTS